MKIGGEWHRTIRLAADGDQAGWAVDILDQTELPYRTSWRRITDAPGMAHAIHDMQVRGAPLIGAAAAYGMALAMRQDPSDGGLASAAALLKASRPTAINLAWAVDDQLRVLRPLPPSGRVVAAYQRAAEICDDDVATCSSIGEHGVKILAARLKEKRAGGPLQVLTHCNAGWLATVDWGTALSPVYRAHEHGLPVHVWVSETRPRNQGLLTAWELGQHGVAHTVIADNAAGHLMRAGRVDICIVGTDRTTRRGDVCNKIGTYLKAVAARDNNVPFYAAVPHSSIDWQLERGEDIPIEERSADEVSRIRGVASGGGIAEVAVLPGTSEAANWAFDVTPARLMTGLITERGVAPASTEGLLSLYPERRSQ